MALGSHRLGYKLGALRGHRLGYKLGYLVRLIYARGTSLSGCSIVRSLALVRSCFGLFPFVPTFLSYRFLTTLTFFLSVSSSCFTLADPMREVYSVGIYTPCMGPPFPVVRADWSLVFRSFWIMLCRWGRTALNP